MTQTNSHAPIFNPERTVDLSAHADVLGHDVVQLARQIDGQVQTPDVDRSDLYQNFDTRLSQVRQTLGEMPPQEKIRFGAYARTLPGVRLANPADDDWGVTRQIIIGDDAQLVRLLQANVTVVEHQQVHGQPLFAEAKQRFMDQTAQGIGEQWISEDARELMERMHGLQVQVGDFSMTHMKELNGFFDLGNRIVIAQGMGTTDMSRMLDLQRNLIRTFDHEGNHAVLERKFSEDIRPLIPWFIEPMAEHINLVKQYGRPELFSPSERRQARIGSETYLPLRDFVDYLITAAPGGAVSPIYLTRAYSAKNFESPDWQAMEAQLDQAWGAEGVFWAIGRRFRDHMAGLQYQLNQAGQTLTPAQMYYNAASQIHMDLTSNPALVFGQEWQKPPRHNRGAVWAPNGR